MPTNVTHTGHARTAEEAELLIEKLMNPPGVDGLPSPLKPSQCESTLNLLISTNKCKKLQFIHTVNGDGSKTAKIIKRQC